MHHYLRRVPPAPEVTTYLLAEYRKNWKNRGLTFRQFLEVTGYQNPVHYLHGKDDPVYARATDGGPELIDVPSVKVQGNLHVMVLLVDFPDLPGQLARSHYEDLLFSRDQFPTQSMTEYYSEVSRQQVDVTGEVHGWFTMPRNYNYYTNGHSGLTDKNHQSQYPRDARRLAEDAVKAAEGVVFDHRLDALDNGTVTALFIVHAGRGAEKLHPAIRGNHIWSHKWNMVHPQEVATDLWTVTYLMVPQEAHLGVCAHELGHLAFQWQDFYDPNYDDDGDEWDGNGMWDLMAGGSYAGQELRPVHPAGLHKLQHGWIEAEEIDSSRKSVVLAPVNRNGSKVLKVRSPRYQDDQCLILENRAREDFDGALPGEGLLVWRVDLSEEMERSVRPGMLLVQADGKHDLLDPNDGNQGDAGDPFPGLEDKHELGDTGDVSTSFPGGPRSGILLKNIRHDPESKEITLDIEFNEPG